MSIFELTIPELVFVVQQLDSDEQTTLISEHIEAETKSPSFYRQHFKCIFFTEYAWILIKTSMKFVP